MAIVSVACSAPQPTPPATPAGWVAGQPIDAALILDAMRGSRRPGGVPDELETGEIAAAVAQRIWTIDGEPWTTVSAGGSCGPVRCTLELGGVREGSAGEDLWVFEVIPASGEVAVLDANLRSIPPEIAASLDGLARASEGRIDAEGLLLVSVRWRPPPEDETFELSYRSGNEEGSCELELTVDIGSGVVHSEGTTGC